MENGNSAFVSIEGILFSKDMQALVCYPSCHRNSVYNIPPSVKSIGDYAFYYCQNWKSITIPSGVTSIGESRLSCCLDFYHSIWNKFPYLILFLEINRNIYRVYKTC